MDLLKRKFWPKKVPCDQCNLKVYPDQLKRHKKGECSKREKLVATPAKEEEPIEVEIGPGGRNRRRAATKASAKLQAAIEDLKRKNEDGETLPEGQELVEQESASDEDSDDEFDALQFDPDDEDDDMEDVEEMEEDQEEDPYSDDDDDIVDFNEVGNVYGGPRRPDRIKPLNVCVNVIAKEAEFREQNFKKGLFENFHTESSSWKVISLDESSQYMPSQTESLPFTFKLNTRSKDSPEERKLPRFGSFATDKNDMMIFAGAPIETADWLPSDTQDEHYLALVTKGRCHSKSLIQIWRFASDFSDGKFVLGIAHNESQVTHICWCPSGNETVAAGKKLPRLGLTGRRLLKWCCQFAVCVPTLQLSQPFARTWNTSHLSH